MSDGRATYLGCYWCDRCGHDSPRQGVWTHNAGGPPIPTAPRLCAKHFEAEHGFTPRARTADELPPPPPVAAPAWRRVIPGLRARPSGEHGIELQSMRNVVLDGAPLAVSDGAWYLPADALVELVLLASAYRDAPAHERALARVQLIRLLHGQEKP